jgi:phospholipid/cholesterol/gamma-HCH transport system permease protein
MGAKRQPAFVMDRVDHPTGHAELRLGGKLAFVDVEPFWRELKRLVRDRPSKGVVVINLGSVQEADGSAVALLLRLRSQLQIRGFGCEVVGAAGQVQAILELYEARAAAGTTPRRQRGGLLERTGQLTVGLLRELQNALGFVGGFVRSFLGILRRPGTANWSDLLPQMERAGADGLPIVLLINFLVGLVMAFQGAVQLKQFGANIFVADLVGLSICRELGPLMTAIIVCGRSGAAFAAELGTMTVNEEIDALRTMGFDPMRFLVFPRAFGLILVLPLLTLLADAIALTGGLVVGVTGLDLTVSAYLTRTRHALDGIDVFSGVVKSLVFGLVIALIACQQGLSASGGAQGVGRRTTSSVVATLFALIVVDACFTVLMTVFRI